MSQHSPPVQQQTGQSDLFREVEQLDQPRRHAHEMDTRQMTPPIHEDITRVQDLITRARDEFVMARDSLESKLARVNQLLGQAQAEMERFLAKSGSTTPAASQISATMDTPLAESPIDNQSSRSEYRSLDKPSVGHDSAMDDRIDPTLPTFGRIYTKKDAMPMIEELVRRQGLEDWTADHVWADARFICRTLYIELLNSGDLTLDVEVQSIPSKLCRALQKKTLKRLHAATGLDLTPAKSDFCLKVVRCQINSWRCQWRRAVLAQGINPRGHAKWQRIWLDHGVPHQQHFFLRNAELMAMRPPPDWVLSLQ
ncbi:hypothetical protein BC940DRAFT_287603 [Gongronella butleri]|nr:hypothetical protein BC940DRAFT_287603 [Gongronella butleri]